MTKQNTPGFRVTELYAFIAVDADGDEGVPAFLDPGTGALMPMVAADKARVDSLRMVARQLVREREGLTVSLRRFTVMTTLEEFKRT